MPGGWRKLAKNLLKVLAFGASCTSCADLSLLQTGICGNFVIDPGEDCDGHPLENGTACVKPGEPNECRQVCNESVVCPTGWGCGHDGVCRQASGDFAALGETIPFATEIRMYPGDFDGDHATDLLLLGHENSIGTRPARIAYANPATASVDMRILPTNFGLPGVGKIESDDGTADIAFGTSDGVSLLQGTPNRTIEFGVFPYFTVPNGAPFRLVSLDVFPDAPGDEFIALMEQTPGQTTIHSLSGSSLEPLMTLPSSLDVLNQVGRGKFDESAPCEQLVFAVRGANGVLVYSPCRTDGTSGWNKAATPTSIALPVGFTVDKGVLVADVDLDGHTDLLIETNGKPQVAWGLGDGSFVSSKSNGAPNVAGPYTMPVGSQGEFPLVAADFNADQLIDFVLPHGLFTSKNGNYSFVYENFGAAWTTAIIADLNDNGFADVIAGSAEAIDFTFLNNAGGGIFNPSTLPTNGPISALTVADFDGDLINDVALVESYLGGNNEQRSNISVGFGRSHGPPSDPVTIGQSENVTELVHARVPDPGEDGTSADNIADLIAINQHTATIDGTEQTIRQMLLFRGNGSRALHTAQPLIDSGSVELPIAAAIAKLGDETPEIVALGAHASTGQLSFWMVEGTELESVQEGEALSDAFHPYGGGLEISFRYGALLAAGNLDGDAYDEVVAIAPYGNAADGAAVVIADFDAMTGGLVALPERPISATVTFDSVLQLHDVDGDGLLDAVLTTGTNENPGDLIVLWGSEDGGLLTDIPEHVQPPGGVTGFTCVPAKHGCTLIVASPSGTHMAPVNAWRSFDLVRMANMPYALSLASGDFDRDGLFDLALHTLDGLMFYRSVPVNP